MAASQQWGVTPPVSTAFPTDKEIVLNDALVEELKNQNNFEAPEDTEKRYVVLEVDPLSAKTSQNTSTTNAAEDHGRIRETCRKREENARSDH